MSNKAVDNYPNAIEFVPECYKTQQMFDKNVNIYPPTIKFVPECFMTHEMCDKAVNSYIVIVIVIVLFDFIPD